MPDPLRYWLLIGEAPSGPFTVAEIQAKLAAQEATWETLACVVGGRTWLPLVRTAGIGPAAPTTGAPQLAPRRRRHRLPYPNTGPTHHHVPNSRQTRRGTVRRAS